MKTKIFTAISILFLTSCASESFTTKCKVLSKNYVAGGTSSSIHSNYNAGTNTYGMPTTSFSNQPSELLAYLNCGSYGEFVSQSYKVWRYTEVGKTYMFYFKLGYWKNKVRLIKEDKEESN